MEDFIRESREPLSGEAQRAPVDNAPSRTLVRLRKSIVVNSATKNTARIDGSVVSPAYYSSFNYWLLPKDQPLGCLSLGVTSPNAGDGKTVVASNLAVSFAVANGKNTLLVDINNVSPSVHKVFDTPLEPGLLDALHETEIHVTETSIKNLNVLSFGEMSRHVSLFPTDHANCSLGQAVPRSTLGLEYLPEFRDVVCSLEQNFEVVIFDLPPINSTGLPALYLRQIGGVIVVVRSGQTRKGEIDRLINTIDASHIRGFVFNRVGDEFFE